MDYITPSDNEPLPEWIQSAISSYDPMTSVVLVFVEDDVYRRATRPVQSDLLEEREGVLSGPAFFRVVARTPSPPECAMSLAN